MRSSAKEVSFEWEIPFFMHIPSMTGMIQTGPYLFKCDSCRSLISPHSMEGRILTGPYHLDCDSCRSQISQFPQTL